MPLLGQEQTAQRAELRAFLHAISQDLRPLRVFTDSTCVISVWETANQSSLVDGDNLDLISAIHSQLRSRDCPVLVSKVEAHSGCLRNDAADAAAKEGARVHHTPAFLHARKAYWQHRATVVARQRMMLEIVLERARVAKREKLLTYESQSSAANQSPTPCDSDSGGYLTHTVSQDRVCLKLAELKPFSRALRFCFGELLYDAMKWYLSRLTWPDVPDNVTRGITWLEMAMAMDFELSTGLLLPAAAKRRTDSKGKRWRRGACDGAVLVINAPEERELQHTLECIPGPPPKYKCTVCLRSGNWGERSRFMRYSCAGKPESTSQAVPRIVLLPVKRKCSNRLSKPLQFLRLATGPNPLQTLFACV